MTTTNNEIDLNDDTNWDKLFDLCQIINENPDFSDLRKDLIDHVIAENNINPAI